VRTRLFRGSAALTVRDPSRWTDSCLRDGANPALTVATACAIPPRTRPQVSTKAAQLRLVRKRRTGKLSSLNVYHVRRIPASYFTVKVVVWSVVLPVAKSLTTITSR